jgi:glycosyltransferase involved in cell wall biosynthesis
MESTTASRQSFCTHGKFFNRGGQKFFFKAMRLPDFGETPDFSEKLKLRRHLENLKAGHTTGLVLSEGQARCVLDIASQAGIPALVELSVDPEDLFGDSRWRDVLARVAHAANIHLGRGSLAGYLIDCPIGQDALRARGLERARRRLAELIRTIKQRDGGALVAIKHRPATRALALQDEDFLFAEVDALDPVELRDFVIAMHNIAEARPVVIEFNEASPGQDEAVAVAFGMGAAGVVAPPVPAPASHDSLGIRMLRGSDLLPFISLNGSCPPPAPQVPMVSVVICAYNAERTMRECLESLTRLVYPNFEVIIVDDGSCDRTAEIAMAFPQFRLIRQPNKGLSAARNVGLHAARGDLVAYTDSDCVVDPHWLTFMVRAMAESGFDACGGPNYAPHEDGRIEACVSASPGAPCHVLVGENLAEHLAGCNMVFKRAALDRVGGFDPQFTAAGDDVDICWRLLDEGLVLGYCPAAFVWHFRRNTIKAYYGQQRGYGRAEALLYRRYPSRFNILGQIKWRGTIPGLARTIPGGNRRRVFWGTSIGGAQSVFEPVLQLLHFLPQTFEWTALWLLGAAISLAAGVSVVPALAMLSLGPVWALYYAWHAPIEKCHASLKSRMLVAMLAYTGPMRRALTRYRTRLQLQGRLAGDAVMRQRPAIHWLRRAIRLAYWNESYITRDNLLDRLLKLFTRSGHPVAIDQGWHDYDLELRPNPWTRVELKTADEEHEGTRLKNHVIARVRLGRISQLGLAAGGLLAGAAALAGLPGTALGLGALTAAAALSAGVQMIDAGRVAYRAVEQCASDLNLIPLGEPIRATKPLAEPASAVATAAAKPRVDMGANQPAAD